MKNTRISWRTLKLTAAIALIGFAVVACRNNFTQDYTLADRIALNSAIAEATSLLHSTEKSEDGTNVATTRFWVTPEAHIAFAEAIGEAQTVVTDGGSSPSLLAEEVVNLTEAQAAFEYARQLGELAPMADRTSLGSAIAAANTLLAVTAVSELNGLDVATSALWTDTVARTAFAAAIAVAQGVFNDGDASLPSITQAISTLANAKSTFTGAMRPGESLTVTDRTSLGGAIATANNLLHVTAVSERGGDDVATSAFWVTGEAHDTFADAIAEAQYVFDYEDATQPEITLAVSALANAQTVFTTARRLGLSATAVEKTALGSAIAAANTLLAVTAVSAVDGADVVTSAFWTTQEIRNTFVTAITAAQGVFNDYENAIQLYVNNAITALAAAHRAFDSARELGELMPTVDRTSLGSAIAAANTFLAVTVTSENNGIDVATTAFWTTLAVRNTFIAAINTAQDAFNDEDATQPGMTAAVTALAAAQTVFTTARIQGTSVTAVDRTALGGAIAAANTMLAVTAVSELNGSDVATSAFWTLPGARTTFVAAITAAQTVFNSATANQTGVNAAVTELATAQGTFNTARQPGTMDTAIILTALASAIEEAEELLENTLVSTTALTVHEDYYWATQANITAFGFSVAVAQNVHDNPANMTTINAAVSTLVVAQMTFEQSRQPGATIVTTALTNAIATANALLPTAGTSANGMDVHFNNLWTTQGVRDTFTAAIDAADDVLDTPAHMAAVNTAVTTLNAATAAFSSARQPGATIDLTALANVMALSNSLLNATHVSTDGVDIFTNQMWTTQAVRTTFTTAITAAQEVLNTPAHMAAVNAEFTSLNNAHSAFNTARAAGTLDRGDGGFVIDFDAGIQVSTLDPIVLGNTGAPAPVVRVLNPGSFDAGSVRWLRDGSEIANGEALVLNAGVHGNRIGEHRITVEVTIGGVLHSRVIAFNVTL